MDLPEGLFTRKEAELAIRKCEIHTSIGKSVQRKRRSVEISVAAGGLSPPNRPACSFLHDKRLENLGWRSSPPMSQSAARMTALQLGTERNRSRGRWAPAASLPHETRLKTCPNSCALVRPAL